MLRSSAIALTLALSMAACSYVESSPEYEAEEVAEMLTVSGSFGYRERIALPPGAKAVVKLSDVSRADAPAVVLAQQDIDLTGLSVPVDYEMTVPSSALQDRGTYAVRAEILSSDDKLLWTTDSRHTIDAGMSDQSLKPITLVKVSAGSGANTAPAFMDKQWTVTSINGDAVTKTNPPTLRFGSDGRISGNGGCNVFSGEYALNSGALTLGNLAVTQRACTPEVGTQEQKFFSVLNDVESLTFDDQGRVHLKTSDGKFVVATL